jgi:hypothetical protein
LIKIKLEDGGAEYGPRVLEGWVKGEKRVVWGWGP